ncbi:MULTISPECIES: peptidylprolyl isomerase [Mameliella]|uniref:Parvulin-like PPIase n=1 Tax=Mameliella alba TaxID=561184 RepID=A0A0B3RHZ3_9RHOB|nr:MULTISPECIES: peptidylprolyl isomerase [Mameliella]MCR9273577.1 peptidylprolyl isomerase [Paracoccaceae bacterium]ODM49786.1 peptidase [Ruegeria sp. PBVC088]KHQ50905.1 putative Peptidyl-prolyl cis-trans isomerase [Mameliella alba]MBY6122008.1 peptidylprolyl isomerase [Mameliella alba]MDD9733222.1 peptidylprolyl isomerase [Mameliella sp. AT18]
MNALFPDVVVNGTTIPSAAIAAEAQNHEAPRGKPGVAWRKAANALAVRALLLQEAQRREIPADPQELEPGRFETGNEARIRALLEDAVQVSPPSEEEVRAEWSRDPSKFRAPPLWSVSHILFACDPQDEEAGKQALARAIDVTGRALGHPKSFGRLARQESDCPSRDRDGMLGQIGPGDTVPEFEAALRTLSAGDITFEPVRTRHGWHVIRMDDRAEGDVLPFEAVAPRLRAAMEKRAWGQGVRDLVTTLSQKADITGADLGNCP